MEKNNNSVPLWLTLMIMGCCLFGMFSYLNKAHYYQGRYETCRQAEEELVKENYKLKSELSSYKKQLDNIDSTVWGYIYRQEIKMSIKPEWTITTNK